MTRKDFEAIAATLASVRPDRGNRYAPRALLTRQKGAFNQWEATVRAMAELCAAHNPRFARDRFFRACGLEAQ